MVLEFLTPEVFAIIDTLGTVGVLLYVYIRSERKLAAKDEQLLACQTARIEDAKKVQDIWKKAMIAAHKVAAEAHP